MSQYSSYPGDPNRPSNSTANAYGLTENRSVGMFVLLNIVTFGIYSIIFYDKLSRDMNIVSADDGKTTQRYVVAFLLSIVTFGIYGAIYFYQLSERMAATAQRRGVRCSFTGTEILIWQILGSLIIVGPYIAAMKLTETMNGLTDDFLYSGRTYAGSAAGFYGNYGPGTGYGSQGTSPYAPGPQTGAYGYGYAPNPQPPSGYQPGYGQAPSYGNPSAPQSYPPVQNAPYSQPGGTPYGSVPTQLGSFPPYPVNQSTSYGTDPSQSVPYGNQTSYSPQYGYTQAAPYPPQSHYTQADPYAAVPQNSSRPAADPAPADGFDPASQGPANQAYTGNEQYAQIGSFPAPDLNAGAFSQDQYPPSSGQL